MGDPGVSSLTPGAGGVSSAASQREQVLRAAGLAGQITAQANPEAMVYMGKNYHVTDPKVAGVLGAFAPKGDEAKVHYPISKAVAKFYSMSGQELADLYKYGSMWKGSDISTSVAAAYDVWNQAVVSTVQAQLVTGVEVDPWTMLKDMAARTQDANKAASKSTTTTRTTLNFTNPDSARYYLSQSLSQELGRAPDDQEINTFISALNAHEKANPVTTTSVSTTDKAGNTVVNATDTSAGGTAAQQFATEFAQAQPGAAEYKGATSFVDTLLNAIKSPIVPNE